MNTLHFVYVNGTLLYHYQCQNKGCPVCKEDVQVECDLARKLQLQIIHVDTQVRKTNSDITELRALLLAKNDYFNAIGQEVSKLRGEARKGNTVQDSDRDTFEIWKEANETLRKKVLRLEDEKETSRKQIVDLQKRANDARSMLNGTYSLRNNVT